MPALRRLLTAVLFALLTASTATAQCRCDCADDGEVALSELVLAIGIVLGTQPSSACPNLFLCADGDPCDAGIDSLITCVQNALRGCSPPSSGPEPTSTAEPATPVPTPALPERTPTRPGPTAMPTLPESPTAVTPDSTPTLPVSTPTATPTCTPPSCPALTCPSGYVAHFPDGCSCPFCATPTRTRTRTPTPTTTACRNVAPRVAPVTSPTEALSQDIFFCGVEVGASHVYVEGAVTDRGERRYLSDEECPISCLGMNRQCFAQPVQLDPNTTYHIRVVQNWGICGGETTVDEDLFGQPLTIRQITSP